jgi:hypothetical protein
MATSSLARSEVGSSKTTFDIFVGLPPYYTCDAITGGNNISRDSFLGHDY